MFSSILRRPRALRLSSFTTSRIIPVTRGKVVGDYSLRNPPIQTRPFVYIRNGTQQPHEHGNQIQQHDDIAPHAQEWIVALKPGLKEPDYLHLAATFEEEFGRLLKTAHVSPTLTYFHHTASTYARPESASFV